MARIRDKEAIEQLLKESRRTKPNVKSRWIIPRAKLSQRWKILLGDKELSAVEFLLHSGLKDRLKEDFISPFFFVRQQGRNKLIKFTNRLGPDLYNDSKSLGGVVCHLVYRQNTQWNWIIKRIRKESAVMVEEFAYEIKEKTKDMQKPQVDALQSELQKMIKQQRNELEELLENGELPQGDNGESLTKEDIAQLEKQLQDSLKGIPDSLKGMGGGAPELKSDSLEELSDLERIIRKFEEVIEYLDKGEGPRDVVSNAAYKYAGRMLKVGIPVEAILHAYALTWPEDARRELEIPKFDVQEFGECKPGQHKVVPYVEALINAGVPAMLVGPTQAGKGYIARNIAENRMLQFGSTPLSAGTSIAWLYGRNMPKGHVGTAFIRCYADGGVYLLDELDAADANLLLAINDALSNDELSNPVVDQVIPKHENFIPLAAANTFGLGADADYTGRERLDMATLERWRMGRVSVEYDRALQVKIIKEEAGESKDETTD